MVSSSRIAEQASIPLSAALHSSDDPTLPLQSDKVILMKQLTCVTLDEENYFCWRVQFSAFLRGHKLMDYVEGKVDLPEGSVAEQQDQVILSWLLSAISPNILPQVAALTTSHEVWECLQLIHSSDSETRLLHLRMRLQTLKKGALTMTQYIKEIAILRDKLASAGEKLCDSQLILIALGGLGADYKSFVTSITTRFDHSMFFTQFQQLLLDFDLQEERMGIAEVNAVSKSLKSEDKSAKSIQCQICSRRGHSATNCFNRVNFIRFPPSHSRKLTPVGFSNVSSPSVNNVSIWYPDSGATTHVTNNGNVLSSSHNHEVTDKLLAANGEHMQVVRTGDVSLSCRGNSFVLNDICVVPSSSKNLLSIYQLCKDNPVSVEFDKQKVRVQDLATKAVMAEGQQEGGLYKLQMQRTNFALTTEKISGDRWHSRLGHLHNQAVTKMMNDSVLPSYCKTFSNCDACLRNKSTSLAHKSSTTIYSSPLELIYTDIWGPSPIISTRGFRYYVNFVDAMTNYNWVYLMTERSEIGKIFQQFKLRIEKQFETQTTDCNNRM